MKSDKKDTRWECVKSIYEHLYLLHLEARGEIEIVETKTIHGLNNHLKIRIRKINTSKKREARRKQLLTTRPLLSLR